MMLMMTTLIRRLAPQSAHALAHALALSLALALPINSAQAACPPAGHTPEQLRTAAPGPGLQPLALELLDCLGHPDPALRDGLAYEQLSAWMRGGKALETATLQTMRQRLTPVLKRGNDAAGFHAPFAALLLSEIARADRIQPFLSEAERDDLLEQAVAYLRGISDRRGYIEGEGWRHGVAHGADLLMQLSLNPKLDAARQQRILQALASQVLADGRHSYVFGEGQRLARPALFAALRAELTAEAWTAWLKTAMPDATAPGGEAAKFVRLHNAREFLWPLFVAISELRDEGARQRLLPPVSAALRSLQ